MLSTALCRLLPSAALEERLHFYSFLHNNRTKMRTEPGVLQGLGAWGVGLPVQGAGTRASLTTTTPPHGLWCVRGRWLFLTSGGFLSGVWREVSPLPAHRSCSPWGAQEQGVVVTAGKGVLSSCGPFPGEGPRARSQSPAVPVLSCVSEPVCRV